MARAWEERGSGEVAEGRADWHQRQQAERQDRQELELSENNASSACSTTGQNCAPRQRKAGVSSMFF